MAGDASITSATTLKLSADLNDNLLQLLHKAGVRVFTMSCGTTSDNYDTLAMQVDQFLCHLLQLCLPTSFFSQCAM